MRTAFYMLIAAAALQAQAQVKKQIYEDKRMKVVYTTRNGLLDGKYTSYYPNSKKKAEGNFKENLRVGRWAVWDTSGVKVEYVVKTDTVSRNEEGYFPHYFLREKDVYIEGRYWRNIHKENNHLLFGNPRFADTLIKRIVRDSLVVFSDEDFLKPISYAELVKVCTADSYEVVQYKMKEDWFIDKTRGWASFRVLGLCPVLVPRSSARGETIHLGWLYFQQIRDVLASQQVSDKSKQVTNLDDVFWYRRFNSVIYKETNVYDKPVAALVKSEKQAMREAERIVLDMLEWEHYFWLHPTQPPFNYLYER